MSINSIGIDSGVKYAVGHCFINQYYSYKDFNLIEFVGSRLSRVSFDNCLITKITLAIDTSFENITLLNTHVEGGVSKADWYKVKLSKSSIGTMSFTGAILNDCTFGPETIISDCTFVNTTFRDCSFEGATFVSSKFSRCRFENCSFRGAWISVESYRASNLFSKCDFDDTTFDTTGFYPHVTTASEEASNSISTDFCRTTTTGIKFTDCKAIAGLNKSRFVENQFIYKNKQTEEKLPEPTKTETNKFNDYYDKDWDGYDVYGMVNYSNTWIKKEEPEAKNKKKAFLFLTDGI